MCCSGHVDPFAWWPERLRARNLPLAPLPQDASGVLASRFSTASDCASQHSQRLHVPLHPRDNDSMDSISAWGHQTAIHQATLRLDPSTHWSSLLCTRPARQPPCNVCDVHVPHGRSLGVPSAVSSAVLGRVPDVPPVLPPAMLGRLP